METKGQTQEERTVIFSYATTIFKAQWVEVNACKGSTLIYNEK